LVHTTLGAAACARTSLPSGRSLNDHSMQDIRHAPQIRAATGSYERPDCGRMVVLACPPAQCLGGLLRYHRSRRLARLLGYAT
jgi:hypothetical protein